MEHFISAWATSILKGLLFLYIYSVIISIYRMQKETTAIVKNFSFYIYIIVIGFIITIEELYYMISGKHGSAHVIGLMDDMIKKQESPEQKEEEKEENCEKEAKNEENIRFRGEFKVKIPKNQ